MDIRPIRDEDWPEVWSLLRATFADNLGMQLVMVDARERFLRRLAGVEDPEQKRRIIGDEFIRVFEEEAAKLGQIDFLVQGTLYPDVIESTSAETKAATTPRDARRSTSDARNPASAVMTAGHPKTTVVQ